MKPTDAAYLAGLLDGEGSYMILKSNPRGSPTWQPVISMATTDEVLTWHVREILGGHVSATRPKSSRYRPAWIWAFKGRAVGPAIEAMWPYIVLKRPQAALLHRLRSEIKAGAAPGQKGRKALNEGTRYRRETMRMACRALNHRGTEALPEAMALALASADLLNLITSPRSPEATDAPLA